MKTDKEMLKHVSSCLTILVVTLLGSGIAMAQGGYPQPTDLYVNGYAGLLTADDAARAVAGKLPGTWPKDLTQRTSDATQASGQEDRVSSARSRRRPFANPLNYFGILLLVVTVAWFFLDRRAKRSSMKKYGKVRRYSAIGAFAGAIIGMVSVVITWLGADSVAAFHMSNCLLPLCVCTGAFAGFVLGGGLGTASGVAEPA